MIPIWVYFLIAIPFLMIGGFVVLHRKSFRQRGIIVKRVGDEHVVVDDRYRTRPRGDKDDIRIIEFLKHSSVKSIAQDFKNSIMFWKSRKDPEDVLEMSTKELKSAVRTGSLFYMPNDTDIKPLKISAHGELNVLDQDTRAFVVAEMQDKQEFMKSGQSKWAQVAMVVGPIFIALLVMVVMWIVFQTQMSENIASLCGQAKSSAGNFADTVRQVAG